MQCVDVSTISQSERYCTHCEKPLKRQFVWLELDFTNGKYDKPGNIKPDNSQGCFPFGVTCARNILKAV